MKTITKWMYHPFDYIAGLPALLIGLGVMVILAGASYFSGLHFDGVVDAHITGERPPLSYYIIEQMLPWFMLFILLYISGRIFSKSSSIRLIDVAGTTAFARIPAILQLGAGLLLVKFLSYSKEFMDKLYQHQIPDPHTLSTTTLVGVICVWPIAMAALVWEIYLFYKAYSISCNIKGNKAIVSFIVVMVVAEILSKVALHLIKNQLL